MKEIILSFLLLWVIIGIVIGGYLLVTTFPIVGIVLFFSFFFCLFWFVLWLMILD